MSPSNQQLLIEGGRVLDIETDLDQPAPADILVENGRIAAVAPSLAAQAGPDARRIDARRKLVIPGLINAHYHSHDVLLRGLFEQLPLDAWFALSSPANYPLSPAEVRLRTALGAAECLLNGITTTQDMVTIIGADRAHLDAMLQAYAESGIRAVVALQISDRATVDAVPFLRELPADVARRLPGASDPSALQRLAEDQLDAAATPRLHWALGPSAPQRCSDALLTWAAALSKRRGLQVFTHLYEAKTQAVLAALDYPDQSLVAHLDRFSLLNEQLTIVHGVWIGRDEIRRLGAAGANLACNPASNMKLLNGFAPIADYAEAGAGLALGCDNCSGNDAQNMFESMKLFALSWGLYAKAGESGAAREAFAAATVGGARALGKASELGRLKPGYRADIVVIDLETTSYRPLNSAVRQLVYSENGKGVHTVIVDGEVVVEDRKLLTLSEPELKAQSEAARERLSPLMSAAKTRSAPLVSYLLDAHERASAYPIPFDRLLVRRQ